MENKIKNPGAVYVPIPGPQATPPELQGGYAPTPPQAIPARGQFAGLHNRNVAPQLKQHKSEYAPLFSLGRVVDESRVKHKDGTPVWQLIVVDPKDAEASTAEGIPVKRVYPKPSAEDTLQRVGADQNQAVSPKPAALLPQPFESVLPPPIDNGDPDLQKGVQVPAHANGDQANPPQVQNIVRTSETEAMEFERAHPLAQQATLKVLERAGFPPSGEVKNPFRSEYWTNYTPTQIQQGQAHLNAAVNKLKSAEGANYLKEILGLSENDWLTQAGNAFAQQTALNQFQLELTKALIEILKSIGNLIAKAASPH
jgi:hypothetical protein